MKFFTILTVLTYLMVPTYGAIAQAQQSPATEMQKIISDQRTYELNCDGALDVAITQAKELHHANDLKSAEDRLKIASEFAKLICKNEGISSVGNKN